MIHLDTHVVAWLFMGEIERFSRKGQTLLETESLAISPIVALELQYLYEINRISLSGATVLAVVRKDFGVAFATHSFQDIIFEAFSLDWTRDPFDRIIVAPGIDMRFDQIENYKPEDTDFIPHAWKGRSATLRLLQQLESMPNGGMVLICPPALPYRCPPAPYERASLVAHYLSQHKPRSKILILDAKEQFPKQALFSAGWKSLYGRMIEWFNGSAGGLILRADAKNMTVETEFGIEKGDVINLIPAQWAGRIARASGLSDESGWCPVDLLTFESTLLPGIHVIGDAAIAGVMPKSGFSANNQAKVTAAAVIALLKEKEPTSYPISNTCYSFLAPDYAIYVTAEYQLSGRELVKINGSGGVSPLNVDLSVRHSEAVSAQRWYDSITQDMFG
ncbi:MAG: cytochrome C [SAR324 cluster bacterium]|uniref:Cytochrome C n=1 Tax=SAR324 cluster bacterium TaxID=2024889 RepID=A0A432GIS3_9DELT|nr:MAG: cytochrome C [SAR324 cluster bacterium]